MRSVINSCIFIKINSNLADTGFIPVMLYQISGVVDNSAGQGTGYRKKNGFVTVTINVWSVPALPSEATLFTLPEGFRPSVGIFNPLVDYNYSSQLYITINTGGEVQLRNSGAAQIVIGSITFPVA